ncbi:MAG TPA: YibE/F family protein [Acidimicrobiia bacterium]|nr:YibE/F family protein [Acidimicrobiia bacterium]
MAHVHGEVILRPAARRQVRILLALLVAPFAVATVVGLVVLWPDRTSVDVPEAIGPAPERAEAVLERVTRAPCPGTEDPDASACWSATARIVTGPRRDEVIELPETGGQGAGSFLEPGDRVVVAHVGGDEPGAGWYFEDFARRRPMLVLGAVFAVAVVLLGRWRGVFSIVGLACSLLLLVRFVLPSILEGHDPVAVAVVGASAVMFVTLYLAHGFNVRTTSAVAGTLASLFVIGILSNLFVEGTRLTGLASEESGFLRALAEGIDLHGLLLGGIVIGSLGVLDDVTVTQASAVWELSLANVTYGFRQLYTTALRIGRDHIASTVNTLVLAYAGASLPLLVLFTLSNRPLGDVLTGEVVAQEIVRTLVGSIGLVASVPLTTALTAFVATRHRGPATQELGVESDDDR